MEILSGIISQNTHIHLLAKKIEKISRSNLTVFLHGQTGCGKEIFAKAIHKASQCNGEFVAVNCGAIPESLFESLLFGHERGAFTGADKTQDGFFTKANNGTLFLDEIAELPLLQQSKLLRVLETGSYHRIGSQQELKYSGRIITATHEDLTRLINEKRFRADLFYRINTFELSIPSLEERRDDIPLLVNYFAKKMGDIKFSECALSYLQHANWPGNIRQLKNTVDRICILAEKPLITASCIEKLQECQFDNKPLEKLARSIITLAKGDKIKAMIDALIAEALVESQGNKTKAAEILGVHRKVVERRFQQYVRKDTEYQNLIFKELTC
jgi:DNA-binding NtrC family response regulator